MASKGKAKSKRKASSVDMECFAYDMFVYAAEKFQIPANCIPQWTNVKKNDYKQPYLIQVLFREMFRYQIKYRNTWYSSFKKGYDSTKLKSSKEVKDLLFNILAFYKPISSFTEVFYSLALMNEFIQFQYSESRSLYFKEVSHIWSKFLDRHKRTVFEGQGGVERMCCLAYRPDQEVVDGFIEEFILKFCFPYGDKTDIADVVAKECKEYFYKIQRNLSRSQQLAYYFVFEDIFAEGKSVVVERYTLQIPLPSEMQESDGATGCDILKNPGIGIQQHEELLHNLGLLVPKTFLDLPGPSRQEEAKERKGSSGAKSKPKRKSSSRSSVEEGIAQMSLGCSESSRSEKK